MTKKLHYHVSQISTLLRTEISEIIKSLITEVLSRETYIDVNFDTSYTIDGTLFNFKVRSVPLLADLCRPEDNPNVITAVTFIHGIPFSLNFERSDFCKPLNEIVKKESLDGMTDLFVETIKIQMAASFYYKGMDEKINEYAEAGEFLSISDYLGIELSLHYDEEGYSLVQYDTEQSSIKYISKVVHFLKNSNKLDQNREAFKRYLNILIIDALASGRCMKNLWSETLN